VDPIMPEDSNEG